MKMIEQQTIRKNIDEIIKIFIELPYEVSEIFFIKKDGLTVVPSVKDMIKMTGNKWNIHVSPFVDYSKDAIF